jgi:hypothetical protein
MDRRRLLPPGFIEPCIPTLAHKPPSSPGWVHEIKHDGYRLIVRLDGEAARLFPLVQRKKRMAGLVGALADGASYGAIWRGRGNAILKPAGGHLK